VLFTGLSAGERGPILEKIAGRVKSKLERDFAPDQWQQVRFSFHFFPDDWDLSNLDDPGNPSLYIDETLAAKRKRIPLAFKRLIDIVFSSVVLAVCLPLFLWIALAIKASSKGPVFFRQRRIGQYGKQFVFLKFRSMYENSEVLVHKNFVKELITHASLEKPLRDERNQLYKIQNDDRVTRVGRFLRRTNLDELPQLLNVLKGEMSLVGPRPAIPYEVEIHQTWHRRRVLAAKPGITGIWQVAGRSRVKFDEMVRMDLRYAMAWSSWLDLKILLLTPFAVFRGNGAF
jgi:lipopolysaccharide/colanic/teichoic acid biosynthesis glycosyltransferase